MVAFLLVFLEGSFAGNFPSSILLERIDGILKLSPVLSDDVTGIPNVDEPPDAEIEYHNIERWTIEDRSVMMRCCFLVFGNSSTKVL